MTEEEYRQQWVEAEYEVMGWWLEKQEAEDDRE